MKQKTIKKEITFGGIGLHSGVSTNIVLKPAPIDTGIVFIKDNQQIKATYNNVVNTHLGTTIGISNCVQKFLSNFFIKFGIVKEYGNVVRTIEHLMASLWACDIDNVYIDIDNKETPIMDGSSYLFIEEIRKAELLELNSDRKYLVVKKVIESRCGNDRFIRLEPSDNFSVSLMIDFNYGGIGKQTHYFNGDKETFVKEISKARTFCNIKDVELMQRHNLAKGGSEDNAMVFDDHKLLNRSGFRYENEAVRHKMLDLIGDMFTSGYNMKCHIEASKSGHSLDNGILRKLFSNENNYELV